jgi:methionyl-tRNA formyltransferase/ubiquinone/menaquinone biosynthesis C-methylase UbiE
MADSGDLDTVLPATASGHALSGVDWRDAHFAHSRAIYEAMARAVGLQTGWRGLGAGCGPGGFLPTRAALVGPGGALTALDLDAANLAIAAGRVAASPLACPVAFRQGSVAALPFPDHAFDAVWCANVSQYLTDDEFATALAECRRVVRSGGLVAVKESDAPVGYYAPLDPAIVWRAHDALLRQGDVQFRGVVRAAALRRWLERAGLADARQQLFPEGSGHRSPSPSASTSRRPTGPSDGCRPTPPAPTPSSTAPTTTTAAATTWPSAACPPGAEGACSAPTDERTVNAIGGARRPREEERSMDTAMSRPAQGLKVVAFHVRADAYAMTVAWAAKHGPTIALLVTTPGPPARRSALYRETIAAGPPEQEIVVTTRPERLAPIIAALSPDLLVCGSFPYRIPPEVVAIPRLGAVNFHPAPLPRYRGPNPLRQLYAGEATLGATLHRIAPELDAGPILAQVSRPTPADATPEAVWAVLGEVFAATFAAGLARAVAGEPGTPQDEAEATYAGAYTAAEHWLDWREPRHAPSPRHRAEPRPARRQGDDRRAGLHHRARHAAARRGRPGRSSSATGTPSPSARAMGLCGWRSRRSSPSQRHRQTRVCGLRPAGIGIGSARSARGGVTWPIHRVPDTLRRRPRRSRPRPPASPARPSPASTSTSRSTAPSTRRYAGRSASDRAGGCSTPAAAAAPSC